MLIGHNGMALAAISLRVHCRPRHPDRPRAHLADACEVFAAPFRATIAAVTNFELRRLHDGLVPGEAAVFH
jgi:hypothetical protein